MFSVMKIKLSKLSMLLLSLMIVNISVLTKDKHTKTTMLSQTFAHIRILSFQLPDQPRADRAMHQLLCTNVKLTRKVLTKNLIRTILRRNIGTNEVERYVRVVCKQNVRKKRNVGMIRNAMKMKLEDAEYDEKITRELFIHKLNEYKNVVTKGSAIDVEFRGIMKCKVEG